VEAAELSEIDVDREVFLVALWFFYPATLPRPKASMKMNDMNNICGIQFIHRSVQVLS